METNAATPMTWSSQMRRKWNDVFFLINGFISGLWMAAWIKWEWCIAITLYLDGDKNLKTVAECQTFPLFSFMSAFLWLLLRFNKVFIPTLLALFFLQERCNTAYKEKTYVTVTLTYRETQSKNNTLLSAVRWSVQNHFQTIYTYWQKWLHTRQAVSTSWQLFYLKSENLWCVKCMCWKKICLQTRKVSLGLKKIPGSILERLNSMHTVCLKEKHVQIQVKSF